MAVTKFIGAIHPPKSGGRYKLLKNTIDYVLNPEKTKDGLYTGSRNCFCESALNEMIKTKESYGKTSSASSERLGYHWTISWSPEENISYEQAMEITEQFIDEYFMGQYEVVYSVHIDQEHVHSHIVFNSVNWYTGYKYQYSNGDWEKTIQPIIDRICEQAGLKKLEYDKEEKRPRRKHNPERKRKSNSYYKESKDIYPWSEYIRNDIDDVIAEVNSYSEFLEEMKKRGYTVKEGKYTAIKAEGMERFRRLYKLGPDYTGEMIQRRIEIKSEERPIRELPEDKTLHFIFPKRLRRNYKAPMSRIQKEYYKKIYQLGLRKKGQYVPYWKVKENLKNIKQLEKELELITKYDISDMASAEKAMADTNMELGAVQNEKNRYFEKRKPYRFLLAKYKKMEKLQKEYHFDIEDCRTMFPSEYEEYQKLKNDIEKNGFTVTEIADISKSFRQEIKDINKEARNIKKKLEMLDKICKEQERLQQSRKKEEKKR